MFIIFILTVFVLNKPNLPIMASNLDGYTQSAHVEIQEGISKVSRKDYEGSVPNFLLAISLLNKQFLECRKIIEEYDKNSAEKSEQEGNDKIRIEEIIDSCIEKNLEYCSFKEIVDLEKPIEDVKATITLPLLVPLAFSNGIRPYSTFLLFGLPGTGKTRFAKAVASFCGKHYPTTFFNASASKIMSKWQSESEKALLGLFHRAETCEKSIIFFDEVDELLSHKKDNDSDTSSRLKSLFLTCTDGINGGLKNTILIAATNRPWVIEPAAWSRFQRKYHVHLPSLKSRKVIFQKEVGSTPNTLTDGDYDKMAGKTNGYSGRDIKSVIVSSWMNCLKQNIKLNETKQIRPLTIDNIYSALKEVKSSIRPEDKTLMEDFLINEFGGTTSCSTSKSRPAFYSGV